MVLVLNLGNEFRKTDEPHSVPTQQDHTPAQPAQQGNVARLPRSVSVEVKEVGRMRELQNRETRDGTCLQQQRHYYETCVAPTRPPPQMHMTSRVSLDGGLLDDFYSEASVRSKSSMSQKALSQHCRQSTLNLRNNQLGAAFLTNMGGWQSCSLWPILFHVFLA